jgi:GNAT superfamily N-acetyltransferase
MEIREESMASLIAHSQIPIGFRVEWVFEVVVENSGAQGISLREHPIDQPYTRDNDVVFDERPSEWGHRFDLRRWGLLAAYDDSERVGGSVIAFDTPEVWMLDGRRDLAALWDLRVRPEVRRAGVGTALFRATEDWARRRGCTQLKIETQSDNVPACRFHLEMGCELGGINRFAYPSSPSDVRLLWFKDL